MITIRMKQCGVDRTLAGYVFTDRAHARLWLSQPFVHRDDVLLEEVEAGPWQPCQRCGVGHTRVVKLIRRLSIDDLV